VGAGERGRHLRLAQKKGHFLGSARRPKISRGGNHRVRWNRSLTTPVVLGVRKRKGKVLSLSLESRPFEYSTRPILAIAGGGSQEKRKRGLVAGERRDTFWSVTGQPPLRPASKKGGPLFYRRPVGSEKLVRQAWRKGEIFLLLFGKRSFAKPACSIKKNPKNGFSRHGQGAKKGGRRPRGGKRVAVVREP